MASQQEMSVSCHLELWEVLSSVLATWQLASLGAQHLREQDRTQELFIAKLQKFHIVITLQHMDVQASQSPLVQGRL